MIRAIVYLAMLAGLMLGVAWVAERPGEVTVVWQGWRADTTVGVAVALVATLGIAVALLLRFWGALIGAPRRFRHWRRDRRLRGGYAALSQGLVAVAAGDPAEARRQARRADRLLEQPALTLLLSAQAAQLTGDEDAAQRHFASMLEQPETAFLGLRGMLARAMRDRDFPRALDLAKRARLLRPKTPWVLTTLFELQTRLGDWEGASETLAAAVSAKALPPATARRLQGAVLLQLSHDAAKNGRDADALRFAKQAYRADPDQIAASAWLAERFVGAGRARRAAKLVEHEWTRRPHPDLLAAYRLARPPSTPLDWVKDVERLASLAPAHADSTRALGTAALEAGLWGEARRHLGAAIAAAGDAPPASLCRKMAQVEESDSGDASLVRPWLTLAAEGHPDSAWICEACGAAHPVWRAACGRCGAVGRLDWRTPDRVAPTVLVSPAAAPSLPPAPPS